MFRPARVRLTVIYCLVFFSIFWIFSGGLYIWMEHSIGEGYISKVTSKQVENGAPMVSAAMSGQTALIAGDVALDQLKYILLVLNVVLIGLVPGLAWLLTSRTLRPIEESYAKQRQFVSDASHELRTPLTIMQGELDIALQRPRSPADYRQALQSTREEVIRLHGLTEALLYIARGDQRTFDLQAVAVDMTDTIDEVVARLMPIAKAKHITVVYEPSVERLVTMGSNEMLQQLCTNLIENALKFTPRSGSVTIVTNRVGHTISLQIIDTGIGMSPEDAAQVFERFYRADASRSKVGFGLGLAICKVIVTQHNGSVSLTSKLGSGTTVTVRLPGA